MARDRRRPTNRHVRRPGRKPLYQEPQRVLDAEGLAAAVDEDIIATALRGDHREPSTWLALMMVLSKQTTEIISEVQRRPSMEAHARIAEAWCAAEDTEEFLEYLREAAARLAGLSHLLRDGWPV